MTSPRPLYHAGTATRRFALVTSAGVFDEWTAGEVERELKSLAGSFRFSLREPIRTIESLEWASLPPVFRLKKGLEARVLIDGELVLLGHIEGIDRSIDAESAEITITGRDKAGDLVDSAAAPDGPAEFKGVKLEEAAQRIAKPFGLTVRSEIETGAPFERYALDLSDTAHQAIVKGAHQRHALVTSDGIGGIVITRTGGQRAPSDLRLPGNIVSSRLSSSDEGRHSETVVRGQSERAGGQRKGRKAALDTTAEPLGPSSRSAPTNDATERERRGTASTGRARDEEITRHRPRVHLARTQADDTTAQDEADWRMRTARAQADELEVSVHDFREEGKLWRVNQLAYVSDDFQEIERDLLISRTAMRYDDNGAMTEMTLISPEAYDPAPVARRRTDAAKTAKTKTKAKGKAGPLDGTAQAL